MIYFNSEIGHEQRGKTGIRRWGESSDLLQGCCAKTKTGGTFFGVWKSKTGLEQSPKRKGDGVENKEMKKKNTKKKKKNN